VKVVTNHGGIGRWETSNYALRRVGHVHDENRRPRYNHRIPYSSRGHPTNLPHPSLNIAINRTGQHIYGIENREKGRRKIGWAQVVYPLRARLQELKDATST